MKEIKIGDIVQGTTASRRKRFGVGIVIGVNGAGRTPVMVIFASQLLDFIVQEFKEDDLEGIKIDHKFRQQITNISSDYRKLVLELKSA